MKEQVAMGGGIALVGRYLVELEIGAGVRLLRYERGVKGRRRRHPTVKMT